MCQWRIRSWSPVWCIWKSDSLEETNFFPSYMVQLQSSLIHYRGCLFWLAISAKTKLLTAMESHVQKFMLYCVLKHFALLSTCCSYKWLAHCSSLITIHNFFSLWYKCAVNSKSPTRNFIICISLLIKLHMNSQPNTLFLTQMFQLT